MLILGHEEVRAALEGRESSVVAAVRDAYRQHASGRTAVPHSVFLRFPGDNRNRIIALPAYLGRDDGHEPGVAGMKWVASFPGNHEHGMPRASAVMVINSMRTGRPEAVLEGSLISAQRTAASAALAASVLSGDSPDRAVAVVGCGVINLEIVRFLRATLPGLRTVALFDVDEARRRAFAEQCAKSWPDLAVETVTSAEEALRRHPLISIATTAAQPYLGTAGCGPGTLILHISLRDLTAEAIMNSDNVVDDVDHVCREQTSVHLAEQQTGHRRFISGTIGELLSDGGYGGGGHSGGAHGHRSTSRSTSKVTVFSPFGLGVLDLAVAELVRQWAISNGVGTEVPDFAA